MDLLVRVQIPIGTHVERGQCPWRRVAFDATRAKIENMKRQTFQEHYYVYVLRSEKDQGFYIGVTSDLKKRFGNHTRGEVISTRGRRPFVLIRYEYFINKKDALARERYLKSGYGREQLEAILKNTLIQTK